MNRTLPPPRHSFWQLSAVRHDRLRGEHRARAIGPLIQQALNFRPISETLDPGVGGKVLLSRTKAMSTLLIQLQFGGITPLLTRDPGRHSSGGCLLSRPSVGKSPRLLRAGLGSRLRRFCQKQQALRCHRGLVNGDVSCLLFR